MRISRNIMPTGPRRPTGRAASTGIAKTAISFRDEVALNVAQCGGNLNFLNPNFYEVIMAVLKFFFINSIGIYIFYGRRVNKVRTF